VSFAGKFQVMESSLRDAVCAIATAVDSAIFVFVTTAMLTCVTNAQNVNMGHRCAHLAMHRDAKVARAAKAM
jgi:hypothetical protein